MNLEQANDIPMPEILQKMGASPLKIKNRTTGITHHFVLIRTQV